MKQLVEIYNLKKDSRLFQLNKDWENTNEKYILKEGEGLLFGTKEWFKAIEDGVIAKYIVKGFISRIYMSGHNDFPEFEIESNEGKTTWAREGVEEAYQIGKYVELMYVQQASKRPLGPIVSVPPIVIQIKIEQ